MIRTDGSTAPLTRPDGSPLRVLVVDDESSFTELLSMALRYEGWEVAHAPRRAARRSGRPGSSGRTPSCST